MGWLANLFFLIWLSVHSGPGPPSPSGTGTFILVSCVSCELRRPVRAWPVLDVTTAAVILPPSDLVSDAATQAAPEAPCGLLPQRRSPLPCSSLMFPRCGC